MKLKPEPQTLLLWERATRSVAEPIPGTEPPPTSACFSRSSRFLALGGQDGVIRLWDVPAGKEVGSLRGHRGPLRSLAFSGDGRLLVSAGADVTGLVWDVACLLKAAPLPRKGLSRADLTRLWEQLSANDGARGFAAVKTLAGNPEPALSLLRDQLRPVRARSEQELDALVADLGSKRFSDRSRAASELSHLGRFAEPALKKALVGHPPLEVRRRVEQLLAEADRNNPKFLRQSRALLALEYADTAEARKLLEQLAAGAPGAWLTEVAHSALSRLDRP
jgi:hypothetical protein